LQGFVVFVKKQSPLSLKRLLMRAHWEVARGTSKEASDYCKKDGNFVEYGDCPVDTRFTAASQASLWDAAREAARQGRFDDIPTHMYVKSRNAWHGIYEDASQAKDCISELNNLWIVGTTGIGKSRWAFEHFPDAYRKPNNKWWDHYSRQEVVILEDVDKAHAAWLPSFLKVWTDHYPFMCERKGGSMAIRPKRFIVTSNYMLNELIDDAKLLAALDRRFQVKTIANGELSDYVHPQVRRVWVGPADLCPAGMSLA
jgi:hypothetical protein